MFPLLPLALLLVAAPAETPDEAPAITVTGSRLTEAGVAQAANAYVRAVLPTPSQGQYARWADPVCVKISGIDDIYAARVAARITAAATAAGVKLARSGCRPNLSVIFTEDAATTTRIIIGRKPKQISRLTSDERTRLLTAPLPVRSWHGLEVRGADGNPAMPGASSALMSANISGGVPLSSILPSDAAQTDSWSSSLINSAIAVWTTSAVVIVDVGLSTGKPLDAVADYVAMVSLAPMKMPPPVPGVPSILALFTTESTSPALSEWDKAFLASLYRIQMNRSGQRQVSQIVSGLKANITR